MTSLWWNLIAIAFGGAVGALGRAGVGMAISRWNADAAPLGTLFANVTGCLLIGGLMAWFDRASLPPAARLLLVTGFCGALTTFSTFGYEILLLAKSDSRPDLALTYAAANIGLGLAAVWLGGRVVEWISPGM